MKRILLILLVAGLSATSCKTNHYADLGDGLYAAVRTSKGEIVMKLEYEKTPVTVANFVSLAEGTNPYVSEEFKEKKYYNGITFHRVIKDFMIQGGDPTGTGRGNPGYRFMDEFNDSLMHSGKGILSMANSGPKTNGSQFFITHAATPWLDGKHTVFGSVVRGMEVVDSIAAVPVAQGSNKPVQDVVMEEVDIIRNGKAAKAFDAVEVMEDYFAAEEARAAERKAELEAFVTRIQEQKATAQTTPTGLAYIVVQEPSGEQPAIGDKVWVDYAGWVEDGTLIDTSEEAIAELFDKRDELLQMHRGNFGPVAMDYSPDSPLIPGFREALLEMKVGEKRRLFIPPHLGWGERGGGPVPPNAQLVFDIEITGIQLEAQN
ncbi:peptidylprolyl isomerase [Robiginitalea sp. M366]|uniref:peptidylprolyl isomerase n=1 Tax=Robiginitalea aestuariiviva TaxID=3036903 RepID=UPI00240D828F|nr:peptidylprolyl isomerase [Robiginitalea aestuariiviva]MDG1573236.1 peptidylprolyl isomerase [Robiginitalea aestuariiviva]